MPLTRREFLKLLGGTSAVVGASSLWIPEVLAAVKAKAGNLPVIWLQGQSCAGCSVSLLNTVKPDIASLITETISLEFHPNVMATAGEQALKIMSDAAANKKGKFVLVVEGSIPVAKKGAYSTMGHKKGGDKTALDWVKELGNSAMAILSVGTCSAFGGIPAGKGNVTKAKAVSEILPEATIINIPGCPSHPDWIVGTIAHTLLYGIPKLDEKKRPTMFFAKVVHEQCERRADFEDGKFAAGFGEDGCLLELGCKGPDAYCDSPVRKWNNKVNWCVEAGSPCIGCCSPDYPDHGGDGLYGKLPLDKVKEIPWDAVAKAKALGKGTLVKG